MGPRLATARRTFDQRRTLRTSPTLNAIGLAGIAMVMLLAAAWVTDQGETAQGLALLLVTVSACLWIGAGAALLWDGGLARTRRLRWALVLYGAGFLLPAAQGGDGGVLYGVQAFFVGLIAVPQVWLANVVFLVGLVLARRGWRWATGLAFLVAAGLGLSLGSVLPTVHVLMGYWVWVTGMGVAAVFVTLPAAAPVAERTIPEAGSNPA